MTRHEAIEVLSKVRDGEYAGGGMRAVEALKVAIEVLGDITGQLPAARVAKLERERADSIRMTKPILDAMRIWLRELKIPRNQGGLGVRADDAWPLEAARDALVKAGENWIEAEAKKAAT